jgi:chemotaxis protein CheC
VPKYGKAIINMLKKYEDLNSVQIDVLTEIGNIGSGNASTALSAMIQKEILIEMPRVSILEFQQAIENNGSPEDLIAAILVRLSGDVQGMILTLMQKIFTDLILGIFFGERERDLLMLSEDEKSALIETGNIMSGAYINAISALTGLTVGVDTPAYTADMLGSVMSVPLIEFGSVGDKILCIDKSVKIDGVSVKSNMLLIPTVESLGPLFERLGV